MKKRPEDETIDSADMVELCLNCTMARCINCLDRNSPRGQEIRKMLREKKKAEREVKRG